MCKGARRPRPHDAHSSLTMTLVLLRILQWPGLPSLPDYGKIVFPDLPPLPLRTVVPDASAAAVALLGQFLR